VKLQHRLATAAEGALVAQLAAQWQCNEALSVLRGQASGLKRLKLLLCKEQWCWLYMFANACFVSLQQSRVAVCFGLLRTAARCAVHVFLHRFCIVWMLQCWNSP